jgi:hypothetical protein
MSHPDQASCRQAGARRQTGRRHDHRAGSRLAVKSGTPHPEISSVEAVKRTLLDDKSVAYVDPASGGTGGIFLPQALRKAWDRGRAEIEDACCFGVPRSKLAASRRSRPTWRS